MPTESFKGEQKKEVISRVDFLKTFITNISLFGVAKEAGAQGVTSEQAEQAMARIKPAILEHPELLVREKLLNWLKTGRVKFAANNILPEMSSSEERNGNERQVLLWYNTGFITQIPDVMNFEDKQALLWLILYHETVHIDDHFSGRMILGPLIADKSISSAEMAQDIWDKEWSAVSQEWVLAKKIGKPHLVPVIFAATRNGETQRTFLQGFYQLQMTGGAVKFNPALSSGFSSRYQQELAKLPLEKRSHDGLNSLYKIGIPAGIGLGAGVAAYGLKKLIDRKNKVAEANMSRNERRQKEKEQNKKDKKSRKK